MRSELDRLIAISAEECGDDSDASEQHTRFVAEMDSFFRLFLRYLRCQSEGPLDWSKVQEPGSELVVPYTQLKKRVCNSSDSNASNTSNLSKLAVLKLNGGLGTTMGCVGPKAPLKCATGWVSSTWPSVKSNASTPNIPPNCPSSSWIPSTRKRKPLKSSASTRIAMSTLFPSNAESIPAHQEGFIPARSATSARLKTGWYPRDTVTSTIP